MDNEEINEIINSSLSSHDAGWRVLEAILLEFSPGSLPGILNTLAHSEGGKWSAEEMNILHEAWQKVVAADEYHRDMGWTWGEGNDER